MKKTYSTPTLAASGNVVRDTLNGISTGSEPVFLKPTSGGSVGFYL